MKGSCIRFQRKGLLIGATLKLLNNKSRVKAITAYLSASIRLDLWAYAHEDYRGELINFVS